MFISVVFVLNLHWQFYTNLLVILLTSIEAYIPAKIFPSVIFSG